MSLSLLSLEGLRAMVTGAGTGLGRQMARGLAEAGADLVICARRIEPLESAAEELRTLGAEVQVIQADLTDEADRQRLLAEAGRIDVLVNNAGGGELKPWGEVTFDDWWKIVNVNLYVPFRLIQLFAPQMMERRFGRIVNISSMLALIGGDPNAFPGLDWDNAPYVVSKHGVQGITHHFGTMLAKHGVTVNSLCPGFFDSENNAGVFTERILNTINARTPVGRLGQDDDLKAAIVFLASPGSKFTTGQSIVVDGGWTAW